MGLRLTTLQYPRARRSTLPAPVAPLSAAADAAEPANSLYRLVLSDWWRVFRLEGLAFWMICGYAIVEYVRPQMIFPALDILPWGLLVLFFALAGRLVEKNAKFVSDPANLLIVAFNLIIIASCFAAESPDVSWANIKTCYYWLIVYFLVVNIVTNESRLLIFMGIFLLASFKVSFTLAKVWAMRGFAFTSWGLQGPQGFMQNSGELSIQMLVYGPLALFLALFLKPYISKLKYRIMLLMPITAAMVVVGASSRGAQVAMAYQLYPTLLKGRLSIRNIILVVVAGWAVWAAIPDQQKARFTAAGDDQTSQQRLLYWKGGMAMIKEHPVLGVGFRNFPSQFQARYPDQVMFGHAQLPHNIFIEVGTDAGYLGLGLFIGLILRKMLAVRQVLRLMRDPRMAGLPYGAMAMGLSAALWGFLIAGQFVTVTYYPFFWVNLAMLVCVLNVAKKAAAERGVT